MPHSDHPRARARQVARAASALALAVALAGCGDTPREEFVSEMRHRGGGLTTALVQHAMDAMTARYRTKTLSFVKLTLDSRDAGVTARVRDPRKTGRLDDLIYTEDGLGSPAPVKVGADDDLDAMAFTVQDVAGLRDVEELVDTALARTRYEGGYVESVTVARTVSAPEITVAVVSPRADAMVAFTADGRFTKVDRV